MKNNMPLSIDELANMNAFEVLWNCSKEHLKEVAIIYKADLNVDNIDKKTIEKRITYKELFTNILTVYHSLLAEGVKKGDIVTYSSISTPELIYTAYACVLLGAIFKPIDIRFNSEELLNQFKQTPSKIFFGSMPFVDKILPVHKDLGVKIIVLFNFEESLPKIVKFASKIQQITTKGGTIKIPDDKIWKNWNQFSLPNYKNNPIIPSTMTTPNDVIHLTATTGTTGTPKQLLHSSSNWNAQLYNASYCGLEFVRGEKLFNNTVPWVDFGIINVIHTFLCNGITIEMDPLWSAEKNAQFIIKNNPHWWLGAPGWLDDLFTNDKYNNAILSNAKYFITGGAPLFPHKHLEYQKKMDIMSNGTGIIVPGYGFSEVSAAASTDLENKVETIGKMWPLVKYEIRDYDTGAIVDKGQEGELWITSKDRRISQVAVGYLNNDEENKRIFSTDEDGNKWARSGDKVVENDDGTITFISRYKNILTYNGFNINCDKISEEVLKEKSVINAIVIGCNTPDGNQMPIVCVETGDMSTDNKTALKSTILSMMSKKFPEYYTPQDIVFYDKFPTISMKVDIQTIKHTLLDEFGEYKGVASPQDTSKKLKKELN